MIGIGISITQYRSLAGGNDPLAQPYFTALGIANDNTVYFSGTAYEITGAQLWTAFNNSVTAARDHSVLSSMLYWNPSIGGTGARHKFQALNPADTDGAYRLIYTGGWTHAATGQKPNGSNGWANSFLNPSTVTNWKTSNTLMFYSHTAATGGTGWNMGVGDFSDGAPLFGLACTRLVNTPIYDSGDFPGARTTAGADINALGFWAGACTANNVRKVYKNGSLLTTNTNTDNIAASNGSMYFGALNDLSAGNAAAGFMAQEMSSIIIASGLSATQIANIYNDVVLPFETALHRN